MFRAAISLLVSRFYSQPAGNAMSSTDSKHIRLTSRWSSSDRSPELPPLVSMVTCWCEAASEDLRPSGEVCDTLTSICSSVSRPRQGPCVQRRCDRFVFPLRRPSHDHNPSTLQPPDQLQQAASRPTAPSSPVDIQTSTPCPAPYRYSSAKACLTPECRPCMV